MARKKDRAMDQDLVQTVAQGCSGVFSGWFEPAFVLMDWDSESHLERFVSAFEQMSRRVSADSAADLLGEETQSKGQGVPLAIVARLRHVAMVSNPQSPGLLGAAVDWDLTKSAGLRIQF